MVLNRCIRFAALVVLTIISSTVGASSSSVPEVAQWGPTVNGLTIGVSIANAQIVKGKPIRVQISVRNVSGARQKVERAFTLSDYRFTVLRAGVVVTQRDPPLPLISHFSGASGHTLENGSSDTEMADINQLYDLKPGVYSLEVQVPLPIGAADNSRTIASAPPISFTIY